ncbi:MFS transporter [Bacillus sp. FSL H8-0547]
MKNHSFHFLWIGQGFANAADVFYIVALLSYMYSVSGSIAMTAAVPFAVTLSRFAGGVTAPFIIDRFSYKTILVYSQLIKTLFLLMLAVCLTLFPGERILTVFPLISVIAFFDGWAVPIRNSLIPYLVPEDRIVRVNGFMAVVDQLVQLGSWPLGSIAVSLVGGKEVLYFSVLLFAGSTIMMSFIQMPHINEGRNEKKGKTKWSSMQEGWKAIWKTPSLRVISVVDFFDSITQVVWIAAVLLVYVEEVLSKGEAWWGYLNSAYFAGLILGGLLCIRFESILKKSIRYAIIAGSTAGGILTLLFGFTTAGTAALLISFLVGIGSEIKLIGQITLIQNHSEKKLLPKVFAARDAILTGVFGISSLLYGMIAEAYGITILFVLSSVILIGTGVYSFTLRKYVRFIEPDKTISSSFL